MPPKNAVKTYVENGYYHAYNRGVEKRNIFMDHQDYVVFLSFLKRYLTEQNDQIYKVRPRYRIDLFEEIELICYCLMPNHFHLLIKQSSSNSITNFMRALMNSYVSYFNKKYQRTGTLFEGKYKAVLVENEPQLLHLTRYIHLNPVSNTNTRSDLVEYKYSSYTEFMGKRSTSWIHPENILGFFKSSQKNSTDDILSYQSFVEDSVEDPMSILTSISIDQE